MSVSSVLILSTKAWHFLSKGEVSTGATFDPHGYTVYQRDPRLLDIQQLSLLPVFHIFGELPKASSTRLCMIGWSL